MTITHKKAAQILKNWNLEAQTISDIYYEGTGNRSENTLGVGDDYVLKFTVNFGKLKKQIELSRALSDIGLLSALPVPTVDGADYVREGECWFCLTRRFPGKQMVSHRFGDGDGRFVGEIIGQLHLALARMEDCVGEADLLANQFVCVAWFAQEEKYAEICEINKRMTARLISQFEELKVF